LLDLHFHLLFQNSEDKKTDEEKKDESEGGSQDEGEGAVDEEEKVEFIADAET